MGKHRISFLELLVSSERETLEVEESENGSRRTYHSPQWHDYSSVLSSVYQPFLRGHSSVSTLRLCFRSLVPPAAEVGDGTDGGTNGRTTPRRGRGLADPLSERGSAGASEERTVVRSLVRLGYAERGHGASSERRARCQRLTRGKRGLGIISSTVVEEDAGCTVICGYSDTFPTGLNCSRT